MRSNIQYCMLCWEAVAFQDWTGLDYDIQAVLLISGLIQVYFKTRECWARSKVGTPSHTSVQTESVSTWKKHTESYRPQGRSRCWLSPSVRSQRCRHLPWVKNIIYFWATKTRHVTLCIFVDFDTPSKQTKLPVCLVCFDHESPNNMCFFHTSDSTFTKGPFLSFLIGKRRKTQLPTLSGQNPSYQKP